MVDQETADEIAQIERELEILRSRQGLMARWSHVAKVYLAITLPILAALYAVLIYTSSSDIVMAVFIFVMIAIVAALIWIIGRQWSVQPDQRRPSQFLPLGAFGGPYGLMDIGGYKSDAETIQDMIVLRKQRLAELKGEPPPSVPSVRRSGQTTETRRGLSKK